jgi:hypothetical protein
MIRENMKIQIVVAVAVAVVILSHFSFFHNPLQA